MRTIVVGPPPAPVEAWLRQRRELGQDLFDEMWEGDHHVAPAPHPSHGLGDQQLAELLGPPARAAGLVGSGPLNIGTPEDYRVPDRAYLRRSIRWGNASNGMRSVMTPWCASTAARCCS